jgi:RNA polymerase primary sigma factor
MPHPKKGRPPAKKQRAPKAKPAEEQETAERVPADGTIEEIVRESEKLIRQRPAVATDSFSQYLENLRRYPVLSPADEHQMAIRAWKGDVTARDGLVKHNLRFVITVAWQHMSTGMSLEDLVQEGNLGLMRAVKRFNPDKQVRFVSYAVWWIRQSVRAAIARDRRPVRVPVNRAVEIARIQRTLRALEGESPGNSPPSYEQVAELCGLSVGTVELLISLGRSEVRLDAPAGDSESGTGTMAERVAGAPDPEVVAERRERRRRIDEALAGLRPRDAEVLRLSFGIGSHRPLTLDEIGVRMGVTRERIRQIRDRGLHQLRAREKDGPLRDFWGSSCED